MKAELQKLIALQNLDTTIRRLEKSNKRYPKGALRSRESSISAPLKLGPGKPSRRGKNMHARGSNEIVEQRGRAERAERNLMSSKNRTNTRPQFAKQTQPANRSQLETQMLEQWSNSNSRSILEGKSRRDCQPEFGSRAKLKAFDDETGTIGDRLAPRARNAKRCLRTAETDERSRENQTRIRDGVAVAEARNRSCTACFMSLRPQMMAEIRRGEEVITCDNCGRILYVAPSESVQADAAAPQPNVAVT